jgi:tripartite-type tricarboxylate transporter receptor subunit TctC
LTGPDCRPPASRGHRSRPPENVTAAGGRPINDLIAGHVKLGTLGSTPLIPHYKADKLFLLVQTTATRSPALPDVPTFQQAGIKRLASGQWLGAFVPQGTQPAVVARLTAEIGKAVAELAIKKNLEDTAQEPIGGTAADFARLVREDFAKFEKLVR